jgi:hypothetical protein
VCFNGFVFDELPLALVKAAVQAAAAAGAAIFFDPGGRGTPRAGRRPGGGDRGSRRRGWPRAKLTPAPRAAAVRAPRPGPRCHTMKSGGRREALDTMMDLSDTVLMTLVRPRGGGGVGLFFGGRAGRAQQGGGAADGSCSMTFVARLLVRPQPPTQLPHLHPTHPSLPQEEALEVTGHSDPLEAAKQVLARPGARTRWAVVKEGGAGALLAERRPDGSVEAHQCPAMQVQAAAGARGEGGRAASAAPLRGRPAHLRP